MGARCTEKVWTKAQVFSLGSDALRLVMRSALRQRHAIMRSVALGHSSGQGCKCRGKLPLVDPPKWPGGPALQPNVAGRRSGLQMRHVVRMQVDIFSFGIILWELATHEMPIRGQLRDVVVGHPLALAHTSAPC